MNKNIFIVGLVIAASLGIGGIFLNRNISKITQDAVVVSKPTNTNNEIPDAPTAQVQSDGVVDFTTAEEVNVRIKDYEYIPKKIKIKAGTKVTWTNEDDMKHNVMLDHEDSDKPHGATLGGDPSKFEGQLLAKGESYSFTFPKASDNPYHCSPHPWMKGQVEVIQ